MGNGDIVGDIYALRVPFPKSAIGKIPKGGMQLDYVGHANVTDRLLQVDPEWTWEPAGFTDHGLPMFDGSGGLWIKLTVCGVTRYGYGDGPDPKQCISDAIRNAAMRFGVALDLWSKEELESSGDGGLRRDQTPSPATSPTGGTPVTPVGEHTPPADENGQGQEGPAGGTPDAGEVSVSGKDGTSPADGYLWQELFDLVDGETRRAYMTVTKANKRSPSVKPDNAKDVTNAELQTAIAYLKES